MISLIDAQRLALAKVRARKVSTLVTVLLLSLLFGVLVMASLVVNGLMQSVDSVKEGSLLTRYIVAVSPTSSYLPGDVSDLQSDPELIAKAKVLYEEMVAEKTADAKRLGIEYSHLVDILPFRKNSDGVERLSLTDPNGITERLMAEKLTGVVSFDKDRLKQVAKNYGAIDVIRQNNFNQFDGSIDALQAGQEIFYDKSDEEELNDHYEHPIVETPVTFLPAQLSRQFILPNNANWTPDSGTLPIVLPQNYIERLLELEPIADDASAKDKLDRLKLLREEALELEFKGCYRNGSSSNLIQQTIQQNKEIELNKNKSDYKKPELIYALPDPTKCENPYIISDTRTASQKKLDENQLIFDRKYNNYGLFGRSNYSDPKSYFINFKVVGISPFRPNTLVGYSHDDIQSRNLKEVLENLLRINGIYQFVPQDLYEQIPDKSPYEWMTVYKPQYIFGPDYGGESYFLEFASAEDANKFIDEQGSIIDVYGNPNPAGRVYVTQMGFSNSSAVDDIQNKVNQVFEYALLGVSILAVIVTWVTVSQTIVSSRRETAVFRAIGFKRLDISLVYLSYTMVLLLSVALLSVVIGFLGAYLLNKYLGNNLTAEVQYSFGGFNLDRVINLIGFNKTQLLTLLVVCLATGLISIAIPLARNVRRNPVLDMREE